jgi:Ca2+/Na+ antiporter
MMHFVLIGLAAGVTAAFLFASVLSGSTAAMLLLLLAPLPILIVALGWGHWAGLIAAATAAACLAVVGMDFLAAFLLGVGLPSWWLGYLTMLSRPPQAAAPQAAPQAAEWYPAGRLLLWAAGISALVVGMTLMSYGTDLSGLQTALRAMLDSRLEDAVGEQLENPEDAARLIDMMVRFVPGAVAATLTLATAFDLWLAGRIVQLSGRLHRPWPRLPDMRLPALAPAFLGAAVAGSFLPGLIGVSASALAASLVIAHVLLGLAVIHAATVGLRGRGFVLGSVYASVLIFGWPVRWPLLLIGLLGITDALVDVRGLLARRRGPPAAPV